MKTVCIVGGTGFVGRHIAGELTRRGYRIRVLSRRRERHRDLLVFPTLQLVQTDVHDAGALKEQFSSCDAVVNLVGILNETGGRNATFDAAHVKLTGNVIEACRANGIARLLHMSALNASPQGPSTYLKTKAAAEELVFGAGKDGLQATCFRPSVIFGPDDDFFNRFAKLLALTPLVFPLACPNARFAPVYVEDVADAFASALEDKHTVGAAYDLCGPNRYTLRELVEYTATTAGLRRRVVGLSDKLSKLQARMLEWAPGKPFSRDNYLSMQVDNVCADNGFEALGISPTGIEAVVPGYLGHNDRTGFYNRLRRVAGRGS